MGQGQSKLDSMAWLAAPGDGAWAMAAQEPGRQRARSQAIACKYVAEMLEDPREGNVAGMKPLLESMSWSNHVCWTCGSAHGSKLKVCSSCRVSRFCSNACQAESWANGHKETCRFLQCVFEPGQGVTIAEMRVFAKNLSEGANLHEALMAVTIRMELLQQCPFLGDEESKKNCHVPSPAVQQEAHALVTEALSLRTSHG